MLENFPPTHPTSVGPSPTSCLKGKAGKILGYYFLALKGSQQSRSSKAFKHIPVAVPVVRNPLVGQGGKRGWMVDNIRSSKGTNSPRRPGERRRVLDCCLRRNDT